MPAIMTEETQQIPGRFRSRLLPKAHTCKTCRDPDLSSLLLPPPVPNHSSSVDVTAIEQKLSIFIPGFSLEKAEQSETCPLCCILVECVYRSGELQRLDNVRCSIRPKLRWSAPFPTDLPAYEAVPASQHALPVQQAISAPHLEHTGHLHVRFHERKRYRKSRGGNEDDAENADVTQSSESESQSESEPESGPNRYGQPGRVRFLGGFPSSSRARYLFGPRRRVRRRYVKVQSPVASWEIDLVKSHEVLPRGRCPIQPTIKPELLKRWLDYCLDDHGHQPEHGNGHSRMLSILEHGTFRAISTLTGRLETMRSLFKFAALSYVWGTQPYYNPALQLGHDGELNHDDDAHELLSSYPPTIRDAAELARAMGIEWIWVDRICIDQENDEEKAFLIPFMNDIFASAELTIVAATGDGTHTGLPGSAGTPRKPETVTEVQCKDFGSIQLLPARPSFNGLIDPCIWRTRGWTFQEQVFSRRILYVYPSEMIFTCCKGTYRESTGLAFSSGAAGSSWGDGGSVPPIIASEMQSKIQTSSGNSPVISTRDFVRCLEEYTSRSLTLEEDRVGAFAGLINIANGSSSSSEAVSDRALLKHGHPLPFFETALTWQHEEYSLWRIPALGSSVAPTWSWASAGTKIHLLDNGDETDRSHWFHYRILANHDVLGLPSWKFSLPAPVQQGDRETLMRQEPWADHLGAAPEYYGHQLATRLPVLHLVTVVFDGLFQPLPMAQHALWPAKSNPQHDGPRLAGNWSVRDGEMIGDTIVPQKEPIFAIVAGNLNTYIMALRPTEEDGVYSRTGIFRASVYQDAKLKVVLRRGLARWTYIRII